ncbi:efflux RND transporter periplasmic adaptor subunit [Pelobacter seleniigenes]|uniref:efflux RND transporter periplasmic adaptor subunit n=1 Tax=Pelobacter seleniigenes TaxID=407188 RepID=UPI00138E46CD|nr:efflux RND transporter periplasmic adaptor subunit [Pelobacter seleniigenes]
MAFYAFSQPQPLPLSVPVVRADMEETVLATGTLNPIKTVEVGAQVSGQLKTLHVQLGERVEKGTLLAEIDPVLQQNSLREARSELANIEADILAKQVRITQYRQAFEREQDMFDQAAGARADLEEAVADYQVAQAELEALQAQQQKALVAVDTAQANLGYTMISAPMTGTVISIAAEEGQTLVSSQSVSTILTLADLERMTVKAEISEADVAKVEPGQEVYFTILGNPEERYEGVLRAIEPSPVDDDSSSTGSAVYYNGLFDVDNRAQRLRVGLTAEVTIILNRARQVLTAPVSVLAEDGSYFETRVDVLVDGRPVPRRVRIGMNNKAQVEIVDGVKEGDRLLVQNAPSESKSETSRLHPPGGQMGPPPGR